MSFSRKVRMASRGQGVRCGARGERGFTAIEMLIATTIMMAVTAATFGLMDPAQGTFAAQPEASDMQQRLRIGVETLYKDLLMAGAGTYSGSAVGTLGNFFATIVPDREGNLNPDPPGTYKPDTVTITYVPQTAAQTTIRDPMPANSSELKVDPLYGCPVGDALCGFKVGMQVMILDDTGAWDAFAITNVQTEALHIQHKGVDLSKAYDGNATITQVNSFTYWLKTDTVAETYQLMRYDGYQSDVPIAENVVGLNFEYFGDPQPARLRPNQTPPTTYGPNPPGLAADNAADSWGAGENCAFMVSAGQQVPRMATLGPANGPLVKLTQTQLTDGPWCPDESAGNRYDVDLLRVRKVRTTLRVQVADKTLRGATGTLFTRGGTSRGGQKFIPDQEIKFDVTPRNLNLGR